jgi:hypothetical protein
MPLDRKPALFNLKMQSFDGSLPFLYLKDAQHRPLSSESFKSIFLVANLALSRELLGPGKVLYWCRFSEASINHILSAAVFKLNCNIETHCITGSVVLDKSAHNVAYCAQAPWLEHATIRDNIIFGSISGYNEIRYDAVIHACALERDLELFEAGDLTGN